MYRNSYQRGMLTVFFSVGSKPLKIWDTHMQDGYITRFLDQDIKSMVLEIGGTNVSTTYITCPKGNMVLGITMPFLVMIVKNLKKYFSFEVTILDETGTRRRFRASNFQSNTQILPLCTVMPIGLSDGWNQIQFNLSEFTRRAYKKQFVEVQKLKINANIRLRRVYFTERLIPEDQLPPEYKLFFPLSSKTAKEKKAIQNAVADKENVKHSTSHKTIVQDVAPLDKLEVMKGSKTSVHSVKKQPSQVSKIASKTQVEVIPEIKVVVETTVENDSQKEDMTATNEQKEVIEKNSEEDTTEVKASSKQASVVSIAEDDQHKTVEAANDTTPPAGETSAPTEETTAGL